MSTLAERWKQVLEPSKPSKPTEADFRREADTVIAEIPAKVEQAMRDKKQSVRITGWLSNENDIACHDVDKLSERLHDARRPHRLNRKDLRGSALMVFDWCVESGFDCFLEFEDVPMNEPEFTLSIRPR
ncbi:MAG: hypothetical protein Q7R83_03220 [bacterium]|nr:hypothetical protein [bacterium]